MKHYQKKISDWYTEVEQSQLDFALQNIANAETVYEDLINHAELLILILTSMKVYYDSSKKGLHAFCS